MEPFAINTTSMALHAWESAQWAQGPVNTYGGPFILVNWLAGLTSVGVTTACVHAGVDVTAALASLPLIGSASEATLNAASGYASCVAGAMLVNTLMLPLRLYMLALFGRRGFESVTRGYAGFWRGYRSWLRRKLREDPTLERRLARRKT